MASLFRSFGSSGMLKRLLRYALVKVDILDTDSLDLDKLDLAWGSTAVVTFQDVGIKLQKLGRLLHLPPSLKLEKAKVLQLRISAPWDIYASPIIIEVEGVQVKLKLASEENLKDEEKRPRSRNATFSDDEELVPDAIDLAASFLETEPPKEKAELQAALRAEAQDLSASVASSSESGSDDDLALGSGQPLSLPVFFANFIQGVVNRTQVSIRGVTFQLDAELPVELHSTTSELVTFQFAIDDITVEGLTTPAQEQEAEGQPPIARRDGKRLIALNRITASLISKANLFDTLSRASSMPSSIAANSPSTTRAPSSLSRSMTTDEALGNSINSSQGQGPQSLMDSEDAFDIPYDLDNSNEDQEDEGIRSTPSTPRALAPQFEPLDNVPRSAHSTVAPPPEAWSSFEREIRSDPGLDEFRRWGEGSEQSQDESSSLLLDRLPGEDSTTLPPEDLALSRVFSHEEAESMYLSALSHASSSQSQEAVHLDPMSQSRNIDDSPHVKRKVSLTDTSVQGTFPGVTGEDVRSGDSNTLVEQRVDFSLTATTNDGGVTSDQSSQLDDVHDGPLHEEVATPRGPTRLIKEVLSLPRASIYVPYHHGSLGSGDLESQASVLPHTPTENAGLDHSVASTMPGAFSVYDSVQPTPVPAQPPKSPPVYPSSSQKAASPHDISVEVHIAPLAVRFDASISFLFAMLVSRLLNVIREQGGSGRQSRTPKQDERSPSTLKLVAEEISVHFLEILAGVADTSERLFSPRLTTFNSEPLLTTSLRNLVVNIETIGAATTTSVDLERFRFGYANDNIISFDQRLQMWASVRDAFPSAGNDISIKYTWSPDSAKCTINTLPLHVNVDLQKLDETFSWFGGLSSFLNMSSSMTSTAPPAPGNTGRTAKKPRGVRFEAPIRPEDKSAASENKINARIGGFRLDLIGKDCSISLDTSAVKLVARDEGVGVGITKMQLSGPILKRSMGDAPINAVIHNTRLEYLLTPRDTDLERLLELITPSKYKFDENDDEIMVDTLLRQRRKGAVMRLNFDLVDVKVGKIQQLECLPALGEELARLGAVAKYIPEDDRPGILTLAIVHNFELEVDVNRQLGSVQASLKDLEVADITLPALIAVAVSSVSVRRNKAEELLETTTTGVSPGQAPVVTMRMIPGAMEPVIKIRTRNINIEYRVSTVMDILGLAQDATPQDYETQLAASVANLGEQAHIAITGRQASPSPSKGKGSAGKPTKLDIVFRDCSVGLNPLGLKSKMVIALTDTQLQVALSTAEDAKASVHINKASILLVDDTSTLDRALPFPRRRTSNAPTPQIVELCSKGFVDICYISAAKATILVGTNADDGTKFLDVEIRDDLLVLETCADSTQTLIALASALKPPTPPSKEVKYRTKVVPVQDLLASISADAFGQAEGTFNFDDDFGLAQELGGEDLEGLDFEEPSQNDHLDLDSHFYDEAVAEDQLANAADSTLTERTTAQDTNDGVLLTNFSSQGSMVDDSDDELVIHENYFGTTSVIQGTAHRWNSAKNAYDTLNDVKVQKSPITLRVRDVHVIWNLFDGYDWDHTREVITKAVEEVETKASERRVRGDHPRTPAEMDAMVEEEETVIGDFLFNSIYIGIPGNRDPRELAQRINADLHDNATETESIATTATATPSRTGSKRSPKRKLRLNRSKRHKITFELKGINVDMVNFPPDSGETQSSIDVRVKDLDIFDHVPTSTWKKFATYDQDAGEQEMGASMVHLEVLNVRPVQNLAAEEIILKASVLPLRLHVDQDALDFITRFFEFKDDSTPTHASPADIPFVQRAEINSIPVKLDFKPKRVDYAGLRSGHTTEFMNFMILDESRMVLRHTIVYGVTGFDKLGQLLNDIWMPDVKRNQLPGVLAGLAPVRSLVNVGSGFKDLIEIPIKEYKKDGKLVRSIGKGAARFAKTTGTEIVKLGAKMAVGTQYVLQGAEGMLVKQPDAREGEWEDEDLDTEETRQISLYAEQPTGVVQGLRGAYSSLTRDLNMARDAIIAIPGEVTESQSAQGAAKAVLKRAPTIIFRPLIGSSKAIGQIAMGATNALDPQNRRRIDEKYKKH